MSECVKKEKTTYYQRNKERLLQKQRDDIQKKYENATEGEDFVVCKLCGYKGADLGTHLKSHGINSKIYKEQFGQDAPIKCDKMCRNVSGEKNPAFNHGGKYSPFSENFIYADPETIKATKKKAAQSRVDNNSNSTTIEYWLKKTNGDVYEAQKLLSERQSTFSLDKCIKKYGEVDGKKRWLDRQEKWHKNYKKSNFSKVSQELFFGISEKLDDLTNIYFAQLNDSKEKDLSGVNYEYRLKLDRVLLPDFIDIKNKKIIEFDGEYWHGERNQYSFDLLTRDAEKEKIYDKFGYKLLRVKERDYNDFKEETIELCVNFLKQ